MSAYRKYLKVVRKARKPAVIALWPGYKRRGTWFVIIDYAEKKDYALELRSRNLVPPKRFPLKPDFR